MTNDDLIDDDDWVPNTTARILVRARTTDRPGLVITMVDGGDEFVLTHEPTGRALPATYASWHDADAFARLLLGGCDWTVEDATTPQHVESWRVAAVAWRERGTT